MLTTDRAFTLTDGSCIAAFRRRDRHGGRGSHPLVVPTLSFSRGKRVNIARGLTGKPGFPRETSSGAKRRCEVVERTGIEPVTSGLQSRALPAELTPRIHMVEPNAAFADLAAHQLSSAG